MKEGYFDSSDVETSFFHFFSIHDRHVRVSRAQSWTEP